MHNHTQHNSAKGKKLKAKFIKITPQQPTSSPPSSTDEPPPCLICCEVIKFSAIYKCNHNQVCWKCALALRYLMKDTSCCICKVNICNMRLCLRIL